MSKHSLLPPHATVSTLFGFDSLRLRKGYFTSDVVGLAIRYWLLYPKYLVACDSLSEDQKDLARSRLFSAYGAATWVLMCEAYKIGLDPSAIYECGRLVKKLYWEDPKRAYRFREIDDNHWPDCMGAWQSELPKSEQAVLRNGVAVFIRLVLHWESAAASPQSSPSPGHSQGEGKAGPGTQDTKDDYMTRLLSLYTNGVSDERLLKAVEVLRNPSLSTNEKLYRLDNLIPIPPNASAETLAETLGVSDTAVKKTKWWKDRMKNRRSEEAKDVDDRQSQLKERGQRLEPHKTSER